MNRKLVLFLIGLATFCIVLFVKRPELVQKFWLWVVGLSGFVIKIIQMIYGVFQRWFDAGQARIEKEKEKLEQKLITIKNKK